MAQEQAGERYAVVLQSDDLYLSTLIVAPTSRSAQPGIHRPTVSINGMETQVLVEQLTAVSPTRLGPLAGQLGLDEIRRVNSAVRQVLALED
ncbi:MAG: type II toxin-antitoxin system PemK/MazF family toxin [Angustibacter sp.]